ncbi:MAG: HAMP domain-containing sensor histidine kinase, partial [Gammaproteobacteria bacterium]
SSTVGSVAVALVVRDALRLVEHDPRRVNISVHVDLPDTLPSVLIGEDDLLLVLINLIFNAFDAMPDGGELSINAETTTCGGVRLMVRDNGTGMDEALVRNATETLYTTKGDNAGTGLGLPLCIEIVQAAGGRLDIWSEQAKGTQITLEFPATTDPGKEEQRNGGEHSDR